ncbi:MAG TPA: hypothetical protein VEF04_04290 [Blastocatellia bacterium]|nr:hypothetical protein [Blastocatellia bacterium]
MSKQDRPPESIDPNLPEPMPDDWKGKTEHSLDEDVIKPDVPGDTPPEHWEPTEDDQRGT